MQIPQSRDELINHLIEQLQFMELSMRSYDDGNTAEAKRLSTSIRILVHDTVKSTSLLKLLGIKDSLEYFSYLEPTDNTNTVAFVGLSSGFTENGFTYYSKTGQPQYKLNFDEWWNQKVIINKKNNIDFSRKQTVLAVANKDGGAHVDPSLNERYAALSRENGFGWQIISDDDDSAVVTNGPELSIVRQTAFELYLTVKNNMEILVPSRNIF